MVLGDLIENRSKYWLSDVLSFRSDGDGRSGCVSSMMSVIERVKSEQTVDVFQTVKLIRAKRPGAVDTLVSCSTFLFQVTPQKTRWCIQILSVLLCAVRTAKLINKITEGKKYTVTPNTKVVFCFEKYY